MNELGPLQLNVVPPAVVRLMDEPEHTGELLPMFTVGTAFTVTVVDAVELQP